MSHRARAILVLIVGTVLGLVVAVGSVVFEPALPSAHAFAVRNEDPAAQLARVIARIQSEYVDQIDRDRLVDSAIRGMLEELDAHSRYLDPVAYEDVRITSSGRYTGVGLDMILEDGRPTVVEAMPGGPAEQAGMHSGDIIVAVDGTVITAENFDRMVGSMRGPAGSTVLLDVRRDDAVDALSFALVRAAIEVQTVRAEYLGDGVGYIRLTGFAENTPGQIELAAAELATRAGLALRGLVLDLRSNPGGVLESAVGVADLFLDDGMIVRGAGRIRHARFEYHAQPGGALEEVPLVVVVNAGSASAAEIVAGALHDHRRARLVGERTYGKGSVQTVMPLAPDRALKITTSRYVLPSGRVLSTEGIEPDLLVRNDDPARQFFGPRNPVPLKQDRQLQRALTTLGFSALAISQRPD